MKIRIEKVKSSYTIHPDKLARWEKWLEDDSFWPKHTGLIHGDLHPGHTLINRNHEVTGLIDWTACAIGDMSTDFLSHHLLFGENGLNELITAYNHAGGRTWPRMKKHITVLLSTSGITVAEYAEASGLRDMHEAAIHMLGKGE